MEIIEQDILEIEQGIICHQVNCFGVARAGLAKQIANKYPKWESSYRKLCIDEYGHRRIDLLGGTHGCSINDHLTIASLFGQYGYGQHEKQTDYTAFEKALRELKFYTGHRYTYDVYFPYKIGCGLAGGDWIIVSRLIELAFPSAVICKRKGD